MGHTHTSPARDQTERCAHNASISWKALLEKAEATAANTKRSLRFPVGSKQAKRSTSLPTPANISQTVASLGTDTMRHRMSDIDPRDAAQHGEVLKASMRMNKDGTYITFFINPEDEDKLAELVRAHAGARYQMAIVRLSDQDEPLVSAETDERNKIVISAAMLCKDAGFQMWLYQNGFTSEHTEGHTIQAVYEHCGISSRAELKDNEVARTKFLGLRDEYLMEK
jgi:hypothetical protein